MRKLTIEEMNKIILEKVPVEERIKAVYLPVVAMDCGCYMANELFSRLRNLGKDFTKKGYRIIKENVEQYKRDNYQVMHSELYENLSAKTKMFYDSIIRDLQLYKLQYRQELLNRKIYLEGEMETSVVIMYIIKEIMRYVMELDRKYSLLISSFLGKDVHYYIKDNVNCVGIVNGLNMILDALGVPTYINSKNIEISYQIFKNSISTLEIWK